jgi:uncharacterized C2H2 Zn-finger protein
MLSLIKKIFKKKPIKKKPCINEGSKPTKTQQEESLSVTIEGIRLLSLNVVSKRLGIEEKTLIRHIRSGDLKAKFFDTKYYIFPADWKDFIMNRKSANAVAEKEAEKVLEGKRYKLHEKFVCPRCEKEFDNQLSLNGHIAGKHGIKTRGSRKKNINIDKPIVTIDFAKRHYDGIREVDWEKWRKDAPNGVSIERELQKSIDWLIKNGKTKKDYRAFLNNWMKTAQRYVYEREYRESQKLKANIGL